MTSISFNKYIKELITYHEALSWLGPRCAMRYTLLMIKSFNHKGLELFFATGKTSGIQAKHKAKLRMQLSALDTAKIIEDMDLGLAGI